MKHLVVVLSLAFAFALNNVTAQTASTNTKATESTACCAAKPDCCKTKPECCKSENSRKRVIRTKKNCKANSCCKRRRGFLGLFPAVRVQKNTPKLKAPRVKLN